MAPRRGVRRARPETAVALAVTLALAVMTLIFSWPSGAGAADPACDKVAAPAGLDLNAGTELKPFRTVARLVQSLQPGETGCLRQGSYSGVLNITRGGRGDAPVTIQSYAGERASIIGRVTIAAPHVEIRDLRLVGVGLPAGPSPLVRASHVLLKDNEITNGHTADCLIAGTKARRVTDVGVRGNRIHDCGLLPRTNRQNGVSVINASRTEIVNNWIYDNADRGAQRLPDADDSSVRLTVIDGSGEGVLFAGDAGSGSDRNVVEQNIITNWQIRDNVESHWDGPVGQDNFVRENCISGGARDDGDGGISDLRTGFVADEN